MGLMGPQAVVEYLKFLLRYNALPVNLSAADPAIMVNLRGLVAVLLGSRASPGIRKPTATSART